MENNAKNLQNTALQVAFTRADEEAKQNRGKTNFAQVQRKITRHNLRIDARAVTDWIGENFSLALTVELAGRGSTDLHADFRSGQYVLRAVRRRLDEPAG
ncbi:MAG: hypothetical protein ABSC72_13395 [Methylovirgula sp.]|jgi:translation initiation factor IF-3